MRQVHSGGAFSADVLSPVSSAILALLFANSASAQFELCETRGSVAGDKFGAAVGAVQDSGGRSLLWIGAPEGSAPGQQANTGILVPLDSSCMMPSPFFFPLTSAATGDTFGTSIVAAGPNRLLVGLPGFDGPAGASSGSVRLINASNGITELVYSGNALNHEAGSGVAIADVDGDGVLDHIIGSPGFQFFNACSGIGFSPRTVGEVKVYSGIDGSLIGRTQGDWHCSFQPVHPREGSVVAGLGDVNGEIGEEFLIGSPRWSTRGFEGRVHVISNDMGTLSRLYTITGPGNFGTAVVGLDDLDGDGAPDFAVGAPSTRQVSLFSGASGTPLQISWTGLHAEFGQTLANVGDQDGDGHADVLVGAPGADGGRGVAHVFSSATGNLLASIWGSEAGERFGDAACAVPSWAGDSRPEIAIGAPAANSEAGRVVVITLDPDAQPQEAYWTRVGSGCAPAGTNGVMPRIGTPNGPPAVGQSRFSISVSETLPGTQAFLFLGLERLPQPFCLDFLGMPSCCLEPLPFRPGLSFATVSTSASSEFGQGIGLGTIPIDPSIPVGLEFYAQWYVMDPGSVAFPGTMTSALRLVTR